VALVFSGGQHYWPDELRYDRSREAVEALFHRDGNAARRALAHPDHFLFSVLGLVPATIELLTGPDDRIPALFFSLFSVASIALLYGLVRRLGESEQAAFLAALVFAASATQLYYSRHLLPYDAAMAMGIGALCVAARPVSNLRGALLCGLLASAAVLTYNGYFLLAGSALLMHALSARSWRDAARRLAVSAGVFALPFAAIAGAGALEGGDFLQVWAGFLRSVTQGSFAEGWWIPFAYLWHAEHLLTALWAAAFAFAAVRLAHGDRSRALLFGVAGILLTYGGLVVGSVALQRFVVYGRQVRQLVPFACVLAALAMQRLAASGSPRRFLARTAIAATVAQAAWNFRTPLTQVFPDEFRRMAERVPRRGDDASRFLLYAEHIYPTPAVYPAVGVVLLARPHPLQFLPYQYEGYGPAERAALREIDIRMRLVEVPTRISSRETMGTPSNPGMPSKSKSRDSESIRPQASRSGFSDPSSSSCTARRRRIGPWIPPDPESAPS
jgi:hypothetical protein